MTAQENLLVTGERATSKKRGANNSNIKKLNKVYAEQLQQDKKEYLSLFSGSSFNK
jgi:hypothetical protein